MDQSNGSSAEHLCRLCRSDQLKWIFRNRILQKHDVNYFSCAHCDLIQTEQPFWLDEAYSSPISILDTGAIARNIECTKLTLCVATSLGLGATNRCLDYGGGHGVFVRMMRDSGMNFQWYDRFAENHYARGFEGDIGTRFDLVTSFEVFEHLSDVLGDIEQLFGQQHRFILVGTVLHQCNPSSWYYYAPETGQHIALYSVKTMNYIGARWGYKTLVGYRGNYTLFFREDETPGVFTQTFLRAVLRSAKARALFTPFVKNAQSLTQTDSDNLLSRLCSVRSPDSGS